MYINSTHAHTHTDIKRLMMENSTVLSVVGDCIIYEQGHFFHGICRIPPEEVGKMKFTDRDWSTTDRFSNGRHVYSCIVVPDILMQLWHF